MERTSSAFLKIRRYFLLVLWLSFFITSAFGQQPAITLKDIPLTWDDYQKKNITDPHSFTAKTYIKYSNQARFHQKGRGSLLVTIKLYSILDKDKSYVKSSFMKIKDTVRKQYLLNHEKGHWIIAKLYFNMLGKTIKTFPFGQQPRLELDSILRENQTAYKKVQQAYDEETNHGRIVAKQEAWEDILLKKLSEAYEHKVDFKDTIIIERSIIRKANN